MFKKGDIVRVSRGYSGDSYSVEVIKMTDDCSFSGTVVSLERTTDPKNVKVGKIFNSFATAAFEIDPDYSTENHIEKLLISLDKIEESWKSLK